MSWFKDGKTPEAKNDDGTKQIGVADLLEEEDLEGLIFGEFEVEDEWQRVCVDEDDLKELGFKKQDFKVGTLDVTTSTDADVSSG